MSESTSVFIKTNASFSEIKIVLEKILNCRMLKVNDVDWQLYSTSLFGLNISLFEASDFEDDRELDLSRFNYLIDIDSQRGAVDTNLEADWRQTASIILGNMISINLNCECLVVNNMETFVKRFFPVI